jgi:hypothetical protein
VVTGSPAFAGDDDGGANDPTKNHHALVLAIRFARRPVFRSDMLDIQHGLVRTSQVDWHHDLPADNPRLVSAARFSYHVNPRPFTWGI